MSLKSKTADERYALLVGYQQMVHGPGKYEHLSAGEAYAWEMLAEFDDEATHEETLAFLEFGGHEDPEAELDRLVETGEIDGYDLPYIERADLGPTEWATFPDIAGVPYLLFWESEQGFVYCEHGKPERKITVGRIIGVELDYRTNVWDKSYVKFRLKREYPGDPDLLPYPYQWSNTRVTHKLHTISRLLANLGVKESLPTGTIEVRSHGVRVFIDI